MRPRVVQAKSVQKSLMPKGVDHFVSVSIEQERALRAKIFDAERR